MRRIPRPRASLVVVLAAVLGAGIACGEPALSAEEFAKQSNAACVAGDAELEKAGADLVKSGQPKTQEIADFFLKEAIPIARRKLDKIEALNPPEDKQGDVKEMLAAGREAIDEVEEGLQDDPEGYLTAKGPDPFADFDEMARELDLDRCASQPVPSAGDATTTTTAPADTPPSS